MEIPAGEYRDCPHGPHPHRALPEREDVASAAEPGLGDRVRGGRGRPPPRRRHLRLQHRERQAAGLPGDAGQRPGGVLQQGTALGPQPRLLLYPTMHTRACTKLMGAFVTFRQTTDSWSKQGRPRTPSTWRARCSWEPCSTCGTPSPAPLPLGTNTLRNLSPERQPATATAWPRPTRPSRPSRPP